MIRFLAHRDHYEREPVWISLHMWNFHHLNMGRDPWSIPMRMTGHDVLLYVKQGELMLTVNGEEEKLTKNQICFISETSLLSIRPHKNTPCDWYMLEFECSEFLFFSVQDGRRVLNVTQAMGEDFFAIDRMLRDRKEYGSDADARLLLILQEAKRSFTAPKEGDRLLLERTQRYVTEHSHEALTVEQVALSLGYHKNHLGRIVKQCTGTTVKKMIAEERARAAKELLRATDNSVSQIASLLSFGSVNDFHKFFTYHTGMTPIAYRKGYVSDANP